MREEERHRSWPARVFEPIVDSLARPQGMGFFLCGASGSGKSALLADLRTALLGAQNGPGLTSPSQAMRWSRQKLAGRRYLHCHVAFSEWARHGGMPLQGVLALELAVAAPELHLPLASGFLTSGRLTEVLAAGGRDGLVLLGDDLDRFIYAPDRTRTADDIAFLEELGGTITVYNLPVWAIFTLGSPRLVSETSAKLRDRFTALHLS